MTTSDVRAYLAQKIAEGTWSPSKGVDTYRPGYLERLARNFQRQEAAGLRVDRQAARGHALTPEHLGRKRNPYKPEYAQLTARTPRAPKAPRVAPAPRVLPRVHVRPPNIPARISELRDARAGDAVVRSATTVQSITSFLYAVRKRQADYRTTERWRVEVGGYDCERGMWGYAFENLSQDVWHGPEHGMSIDAMLTDWKRSGMTFERWLLNAINENTSETIIGSRGLAHLCLFQVNAYLFAASSATALRAG